MREVFTKVENYWVEFSLEIKVLDRKLYLLLLQMYLYYAFM